MGGYLLILKDTCSPRAQSFILVETHMPFRMAPRMLTFLSQLLDPSGPGPVGSIGSNIGGLDLPSVSMLSMASENQANSLQQGLTPNQGGPPFWFASTPSSQGTEVQTITTFLPLRATTTRIQVMITDMTWGLIRMMWQNVFPSTKVWGQLSRSRACSLLAEV